MRTAVLLALLLPSVACAQQVGDMILVIRETDLKSGNTTVIPVERGLHLKVEAVNGDWFWVERSSRGGWINRRDVIPSSRAVDYFTEAVRRNPTWDNYHDRALAWEVRGDLGRALADFNESIRLNPRDGTAYGNRGRIWMAKGEHDRALADYNEALRLGRKDAMMYYNRGNAWASKGEFDRAIADFNEATRLDPKDADSYSSRGSVRALQGEYDKAIAEYGEAIRLNPKDGWSYNILALIQATCPDERYRDGRKAVQNATKACELSRWREPATIGTLAAAYAESGDFEKAVEWQRKALDLAPENEKNDYRFPLKLYQDRKPSRLEN